MTFKCNPIFRHRAVSSLMTAFVFFSVFLCSGNNLLADNTKSMKKTNSFATPDFAFPETVIQNAETILSATASDSDVVKALIQISLAKEIRSESFSSELLARIDSVAAARGGSTAAILYSFEADILYALYSSNWDADSRVLPLDAPFPDDVAQWSGDMFRLRVLELCHKSLFDTTLLKATSTAEWSAVFVSLSDEQKELCPDLYTFLAVRNSENLLRIASDAKMPIPFFKSGSDYLNPGQKCLGYATELIDELAAYARDIKSVSLLAYLIPRLQFESSDDTFTYAMDAYAEYKGREDASLLLLAAKNYIENGRVNYADDKAREAYCNRCDLWETASKEYLECFPKSKYANNVNNALRDFADEVIRVNASGIYRSDTDVKVDVVGVGADKTMYLKLFRLKGIPKERMSNIERIKSSKYSEVVDAIAVKGESDKCNRDTVTVNFGKLPYGEYAIVLASTGGINYRGVIEDDDEWVTFRVSDISAFYLEDRDNQSSDSTVGVYAIDNANGAPLSGVDVKYTSNSYREHGVTLCSGSTDESGFSRFPVKDYTGGIEFELSKGDDKFTSNTYRYSRNSKSDNSIGAKIYTDLALYHPGDTVNFAVVTYRLGKDISQLAKDVKLKIRLINASRVQTDSIVLQSDGFGRCTGAFKLPESGMNGTYSILARVEGRISVIGSADVEVADYVLPKFFVEAKPTAMAYMPGDTVTINGKVQTYSGMPVAGASVKVSIEYDNFWYWGYRGGDSDSFSADLKCGDDGSFSLQLPTDNLPKKYTRGFFTVKVAATAPSGETRQSGYSYFSLGAKSKLAISSNGIIKIDKDTIELNAVVTDLDGMPMTTQLDYTLTNDADGKVVAKGSFASPRLELESEAIPSGCYTWKVSIPESDVKQSSTITFYRDSDKMPAQESVLWIPQTEFIAKRGTYEVEVTVGSSFADSHILCVVSDKNGLLSRRWIKVNAENAKVKLPVPTSQNCCYASFITVRNGEYTKKVVSIISQQQAEMLEAEIVTFRDKITSGSNETWRFRYRVGKQLAGVIPVMATMTDKALNSIRPFYWGSLPQYTRYCNTTLSGFDFSYSSGSWYFTLKRLKDTSIATFPALNTYGQPFGRFGRAEMLCDFSLCPTGSAPVRGYGSSNGVKAKMVSMSVSSNMAENVEESEQSFGVVESADDSKQYRPSQCPIAFFMPTLETDAEGVLDLAFTAPDFNTTWQLQILAYTPELKSDVKRLECTASKKVMVQSQLPQFLRTGDKTVARFTAFNNSGNYADITVVVSVFNPYTGSVICEKEFAPQHTADKASFVSELEFSAPSDIEKVGVKVMATLGGSSDGEQSLIGILPSSTPVTESTPFYLSSSDTSLTVDMPEHSDSQTWFSYCDNPVWTVVTSLPDMTFDSDASVLSLVRRFYGNSIAAGLAADYPQIKEAIKLWKEEGDANLISPLSRNSELKIADLENTPWTLNAQSETERMQRLSVLLDSTACSERLDAALQQLLKRQNREGGWSWCDGMAVSPYITGKVLLYFSMLRQMNYLPDDRNINIAIDRAVAYIDNMLYNDYRRNQKYFGLTQMLGYLYVRSGLGEIRMSNDFASLKKKAVKSIVKDWREFGIYDAATAAILLKREGYDMQARTILESLRQKAMSSPQKGMWFDNLSSSWNGRNKVITTMQVLEAFSEVMPQDKAVEQLRQWLILQKQTEDWGTAAEVSEAVYAILTSGVDWRSDFAPASFTLNGKKLEVSKRDALTGSFTMPIEQTGKLTISKSEGHQSWGGILSRFIQPITEVKAYSASDIAITKTLLRVVEDENGERTYALKEGDKLHIGDKVRVQLLITSQRDMDYVSIIDNRSASLSPIEQLSDYVWQESSGYYRDVQSDCTNLFYDFLKKGTTYATYDCYVTQEGTYTLGIAQTQCLYAPMQTAHSAGSVIDVTE